MRDQAYHQYNFHLSELEHRYGANVHLLSDPVLLSLLARLSRPETLQPEITWLVRELYQSLVRTIIAAEFPRTHSEVRTRMFNSTPNGVWAGSVLDQHTKAVTVDIARAGTLPSQIVFESLVHLLDPDAVRQDHVYMNRVTNDEGAVTGISVAGSKIGGPVGNAIVIIPDPMGATGSSIAHTIGMYKALDGGAPRKIITAHLIITPEYLETVARYHPDVIVYAIRLDRGLSSSEILKSIPGQHWSAERGLNERQYIVPGAGGLGEILNNSYV